MLTTLTICLVLLAIPSPADEMRAAVADVKQLPAEARPSTRYLTLYEIAPAQRATALKTVSYVLNALSRTRAISKPTLVTPTLIRFSIAQYVLRPDEFIAWTAAWEKLGQSDPYFHLRTEVLANGSGTSGEGREYRNSGPSSLAPHSSSLTLTTDGGWVDLSAAAKLRTATQSNAALLRADYFLAQSTTTPRYYEFAGIPNSENEFLKSLGLDRNAVDHLHANAGANLAVSGVTAKPRRIVWAQGPLGGVYSTLDVDSVDAARDPLRRPITVNLPRPLGEGRGEGAGTLTFAFRYDLGEWFALAPNGLWRTALFNAAGRRQDSVPDRVAKDTSDPAGDGIVVPLISCIRCHLEAGLRPFADDETKLLHDGADFLSPDPNIIQRAVEFYDEPRLQRQMRFDRETYAAALARATAGLTSAELAKSLAGIVRNYAYLPVTLNEAARDVGLAPAEFQTALSATHDPVILLLLENHPVLRGQWESSFAEAALAAQTYRNTHAPKTNISK